jgi:hypothetical protein
MDRRYANCRARGICFGCKNQPAEEGRAYCPTCADQRSIERYGNPRKQPNRRIPVERIDWAKSVRENARTLGVSRAAIQYWRKKLNTITA